MGKAAILDALPTLSLAERSEVLARLLQLEESEPTDAEKAALDAEIEAFSADADPGAPLNDVLGRLRRRS